MGFLGCLKLLLLILIITSCSRTLLADPRTNVAGFLCTPQKAVSGAVLANNFIAAMNNLSTLVNQQGYGTAEVGTGPNSVFALAQCFGDLNATDCILCFSEIRSILPKCYPQTGGRIFFDGCFGRYENYSFFDEGMDSKDSRNCSLGKNNTEPGAFREDLRGVAGIVSSEAQKHKAFAVGAKSISNSTVYALAQCWENLDKKTCNSCLRAAATSILSCSPAVDGRSLHAGCYMRYSDKVFWNADQGSDSSGKHKRLLIILPLALVGFLVLAGIGVWKLKGSMQRSNSEAFKETYGSGLPAAISKSKLSFNYQDLRKATKNFDLSVKLGQGSYGAVYKGALPDGREVAVKRLFLNTRQWVDQFFNEVDLISQLHHKNLVKLLGCSLDGPESLLVYEYYFNRSLDHFIFDSNQAKLLDWKKRISIIQGVAEGLYYLHEESEIKIIHRDIKASNILLDDKFKPKITDFGLARSFAPDQTHLSTGIAGTLGYMAPEYIVHGHLTEKADVYGYGVLLLEIVTGQRCTTGTGGRAGRSFLAEIWSAYKTKSVKRIIDERIYGEEIENEFLHMVHVGLLCTQATAHCRPTMAKVVELLRSNSNEGDLFPTEPPFLDDIEDENKDYQSTHLLSGTSAASFSASSESLNQGR